MGKILSDLILNVWAVMGNVWDGLYLILIRVCVLVIGFTNVVLLLISDDLIQIVSRLDQSRDIDGSCRITKQILDFLELHTGDYRLNQVCVSVLHLVIL